MKTPKRPAKTKKSSLRAVRFTDDDERILSELCASEERELSDVVRRAVRHYYECKKK